MVKGNERRIIVIERLSDPYFEKAVFYVRCGVSVRKGSMSLSDRAQQIYDDLALCPGHTSAHSRTDTPSSSSRSELQNKAKQTGTQNIFRRFFSPKKG